MMKLKQFSENGLQKLRLFNNKNSNQVIILPEFGATISELVLSKNSQSHSLLDGNISRKNITGDAIYKGAKLIPFPNRVANGTYEFRDKIYQLKCNERDLNNALHGFLFNKSFSLDEVKESEKEVSATLEYKYPGDVIGYPFPLVVRITYTLSQADGFGCSTKIINTGQEPIPVGDGWHPYFTFNSKVDELLLKLPVDQKIELNKQMIPNGKRRVFKEFDKLRPLGSTIIDNCFSVKKGQKIQTTELHNPLKNIAVKFWQETGPGKYNYLQAYIPPHRESIAIEPMTCNVNAFNNKEGLIILKKDQYFEARYGVKVI